MGSLEWKNQKESQYGRDGVGSDDFRSVICASDGRVAGMDTVKKLKKQEVKKMPNGNRRGRGPGGGMGLGFRGSSPPWPYVGMGRGGLPRCGYVPHGVIAPSYQPLARARAAAYAPFSAPINKEEELSYLKDQAQAIKERLDNIESGMYDLEVKEQ